MRVNMCIYLCAKEQEGPMRPALPAGVAHFHAHGMCNVDVHFLSQLLPYPRSAGSYCGPVRPRPRAFVGLLALPPSLFGDFIYYLWGSVLFGDSGFYFSAGFDRYSGKGGRERGGGRESIWFCFMTCGGGSVKF